MKRDKRFLKLVGDWADAIGTRKAIARLVVREVSVALADKICNRRYDSIPGQSDYAVISEEMARDGFLTNSRHNDSSDDEPPPTPKHAA